MSIDRQWVPDDWVKKVSETPVTEDLALSDGQILEIARLLYWHQNDVLAEKQVREFHQKKSQSRRIQSLRGVAGSAVRELHQVLINPVLRDKLLPIYEQIPPETHSYWLRTSEDASVVDM